MKDAQNPRSPSCLKSNITRDPTGMINELFKPDVIGLDLFSALLSLINEVKSENLVLHFMKIAIIASIYKLRGSESSLENDRVISC